jgi:hypothetical protein
MWRGESEDFRFHIPLIKPDGRFSRIRLSDKFQAFAHGRCAVSFSNRSRPSVS